MKFVAAAGVIGITYLIVDRLMCTNCNPNRSNIRTPPWISQTFFADVSVAQ